MRQGDPLSCPLFDLAIEPLACLFRKDPEVHGLNIPGLLEKIIIRLFADDTNLYLSKRDRVDHIQKILERWCKASGAKFNIDKTEIIPFGTETYEQRTLTTRKINQEDQETVPENIRITEDGGEAVRILGAWIGNKTEDHTPWENIINKVEEKLTRWEKIHPMLNGRRLITQAIIGGHTQFLTKAQGMPTKIEETISKMITKFIWQDDSSPRIAIDTLQRPLEEGGLNLPNIKHRNEAIEIMWLKEYLNFSHNRQPWATITDLIINAVIPQSESSTSRKTKRNPFTQIWNVPTKGPNAERLNDDIKRMLKTAKNTEQT